MIFLAGIIFGNASNHSPYAADAPRVENMNLDGKGLKEEAEAQDRCVLSVPSLSYATGVRRSGLQGKIAGTTQGNGA